MLNLFPMPNATDPTGSRQYNYTYQNVLEKPRNDQVARVDYNINRDTTFYTRVQFGNEVNSRGANAFLGAGTGNGGNAGWPQFNTSYEVGSVSMVSTLLHTFNSSTVGEVTIGRNWARAAGQPRVAGRARSERSPRRARRAGPVLPERQPAVPRAADQLRRHQRPAEHPRRRRRRPLSVQRQQHHLELLREPVEDRRPAQPQDRRSSSSTRRVRRRARRCSTATSTSTATPATRSIPTSGSPTRCSDRSTATPSRRPSRTPRAGSTRPRSSCRTTGA